MSYSQSFRLVAKAVKRAEVPCVLIGGFAINFYHVARQTMDVDFLITSDGLQKIKKNLEHAGYTKEYSRKIFARFKGRDAHLVDLDFLFVEEDTLEMIKRAGKEVSIAGQKFVVPSLKNLLALKLHAIKSNPKTRLLKDLPDVIDLIRANKLDAKAQEFKILCLKYANANIYSTILKYLGK
jgi:predicted nucleotidyltransferase